MDSKKEIIGKLQRDILQWQGFKTARANDALNFGLGAIEEAFPNGVFPTGAIHEVMSPEPEQAAVAGGFIGALLGCLMKQNEGACIWIGTNRKLFPVVLDDFSVKPHHVIFIDVANEKDVLWAMEEALKCEGLAAVIAEVKDISFAQSRRLQLATEHSRVTGFLLRNGKQKTSASTCVARWQINSLPSETENDLPGVGFPRWQVDLLKVRNGNPGRWQLEWAAGRFVEVEQASITQIHEFEEIRQVG